MTMRAPSARHTETGTGLTSAPSTTHRPSTFTGVNTPGRAKEARTASDDATLAQPHFVAGFEVSGDGREGDGEVGKGAVAEIAVEQRHEPGASDQAAGGNPEVEVAEDAEPAQPDDPLLEHVEAVAQIDAAYDRADRSAAQDVALDPCVL
jgi:hypothetical protein